jgi:IS4 transposase
VQHDRSQRPISVQNEKAIEAVLKEIVHPVTLSKIAVFRALGLRARSLSLPVMVGLVLSLIWRQMGSVCELARVVQREVVLWVPKTKVTQQAINARLRAMPAELFENVLEEVLPVMRARWAKRKRPLSKVMTWLQSRYTQVLICDGSTLDALIRKIGLLQDLKTHPLAGRMSVLLDMASCLPVWIGYTPDAAAHDQRFWDDILSRVREGSLLVFDLGYTNFERFVQMTRQKITFVTRAKGNMAFRVKEDIVRSANMRDRVVWIGESDKDTTQLMRLVEVLYLGKWYRYLSNELDAQRLPAEMLVDLYRQRWRIEDAFLTTKSLLGLSYFFCGAENAIRLQLWATWLLYAVLVDVTDTVAEALKHPFADISMEMVYRALSHYVHVASQGEADDPIAYLVANYKLYGLIKRKKSPRKIKTDTPLLPLTDDNFS